METFDLVSATSFDAAFLKEYTQMDVYASIMINSLQDDIDGKEDTEQFDCLDEDREHLEQVLTSVLGQAVFHYEQPIEAHFMTKGDYATTMCVHRLSSDWNNGSVVLLWGIKLLSCGNC
jgi:hypothetical protein